jgi:hypothetical protein
MENQQTYTTDQIATAARELREAAGVNEEQYTGDQVIAMLDNEIRMLRERGFTDERIADLFSGFDIAVTPEQIARHAPPKL